MRGMDMAGPTKLKTAKDLILNDAEQEQIAELERDNLTLQREQMHFNQRQATLGRLIEGRLGLAKGALGTTHQIEDGRVVEIDSTNGEG